MSQNNPEIPPNLQNKIKFPVQNPTPDLDLGRRTKKAKKLKKIRKKSRKNPKNPKVKKRRRKIDQTVKKVHRVLKVDQAQGGEVKVLNLLRKFKMFSLPLLHKEVLSLKQVIKLYFSKWEKVIYKSAMLDLDRSCTNLY